MPIRPNAGVRALTVSLLTNAAFCSLHLWTSAVFDFTCLLAGLVRLALSHFCTCFFSFLQLHLSHVPTRFVYWPAWFWTCFLFQRASCFDLLHHWPLDISHPLLSRLGLYSWSLLAAREIPDAFKGPAIMYTSRVYLSVLKLVSIVRCNWFSWPLVQFRVVSGELVWNTSNRGKTHNPVSKMHLISEKQ